jgi:outer membrane protein assembly factor BamA
LYKAKITILLIVRPLKRFSIAYNTWLISLVLLLLASSCNLTKMVPDNETLLNRNKIKGFEMASKSELNEQIRHQPNRKILGVLKFHLWAYQIGAKRIVNKELKDTSRYRSLLMNTVGEPPVLLDSALIISSATNLKNYVFNKGYFDATVEYETKSIFKRSTVTYTINEGSAYKIENVIINSTDKNVYNLINASSDKSFLKIGKPVDFDLIAKERERITLLLKNSGYYYFNKAFIDFQLDTNYLAKTAKISLNIRNKLIESEHEVQLIKNVYFYVSTGVEFYDTLRSKGVIYMLNGFNVKLPILHYSVILGEKQLYRQKNVDYTYSKLLGLGIFKFVNISFVPDSISGQLNCYIEVAPSLKHDFIWEPQVITSERSLGLQNNLGRNYGIANEFILKNKNVFGNAEELNISWRSSFETQLDAQSRFGPFSSISNSLTASLNFPKLIGLKKLDRNPKFQNNKTLVTATFLNEQNYNYIRTVFPLTYTYQLNTKLTTFYVAPFQLSFNQAKVSSTFGDQLNSNDSLFIARLFSNYIITGPKLSLFYSQKNIKPNNFFTINANVLEVSGLLFSQFYKNQKILNVPFSKFIRSDVDIRFHHKIDINNKLVYRIYGGIGYPIGNTFLPFERRFFVGGSNSLRAWRPRTIGPGAYNESKGLQIDKSGEMLLQGNIEYRFNIIKKRLEGALFVDIGNIWNLKADSIFDNSKFKVKTFYNEFAINTGLGLRVDFDFFILRADWGIPLHDPTFPETERWVIKNLSDKKWFFKETLMNIAVGYPF